MNAIKHFITYIPHSRLLIVSIAVLICSQSVMAQEDKLHYPEKAHNVSLFADIGGKLHGIAFDNHNSMYIGRNGKEILKVSPKAEITTFAVIEDASGYYSDGPGDTYIYDMEFGKEGNLYVAAEDRVLKIDRNGRIITLVKQKFDGRWGACGIALDNNGSVYVAFDNKILRILPNGSKSIFIDSQKTGVALEAVVGLEFDSDIKNLYICDGKRGGTGQLIKMPIKADGSPGKAKVIFKKAGYRPEYISIHPDDDMVLKSPENSNFVFIRKRQDPFIVKMENSAFGEISTIAFGKKGFRRKAIYGTEWFEGKIYMIDF